MGNSGLFISIEGIDGAGKSTQLNALKDHLIAAGHAVTATREPGGSPGAEEIRRLLVEGETSRWSPETEILLFTAARRDHLERRIQPALDRGEIVLTDRFADSTRVYQGAVRSDLRRTVDALHDLMIGIEPDRTIILDMDPEVALSRGLARGTTEDRFEAFGVDFQRALQKGFRAMADEHPARCVLVDANRDNAAIAAEIASLADQVIDGRS